MNYILNGFQALKASCFAGLLIYAVIIALLYLLKKRRTLSRRCLFEAIFCIYCVTLLNLTGIFTLHYSLSGTFSYNLVPFIGSAIVPILLNFALFFPLGFFLPLIFRSFCGNWKKAVAVCGLVSLSIELLQLFGGRYAEVEDLLINTSGGFSGYIVAACIHKWKTNRKTAVISLLSLCLALVLCFAGIYAIGDNEKPMPDGLSAVESSISEINVYSGGEKRSIDANSYIYSTFASQLSNCGGHLLEIRQVSESDIQKDTDSFIEIIYTTPQTITFENAENFSIENADRLLYDADRNMLYWGDSGYQNCLDYTQMDGEQQAHRAEILNQYEELTALIRDSFEQ